jgi:transposase
VIPTDSRSSSSRSRRTTHSVGRRDANQALAWDGKDDGGWKFTGQQQPEPVFASLLRGKRRITELCHDQELSQTLLRRWHGQVLEAGAERSGGVWERSLQAEQRRRIAELERALVEDALRAQDPGERL